MCGLVGIAGALAIKDEATMKRLLLLDFFRGPDSTGLASVRIGGDIKIAKVPSNPLDLFDMTKCRDALNGITSKVFLGHNRAATRGVVNHYNTHPFQVDHIVGAHNGTLDNSSVIALEKALGERFPVDSQAIIAGIAKLGLKETISLLQGAWSITYYDTSDGTLNFIRNKERPMWYAYGKSDDKFDRLLWASEWEMIDSAARVMGGYRLHVDEQNHGFWLTEVDAHYCWDIDALRAGSKELPKPRVKTMKGKEPTPAASSGYTPFKMREADLAFTQDTSGTSRTTTSGSASPKTEQKIIHLLGDNSDPFAGQITRARFDDLVRHGCDFCKKPITWGDVGLTIYDSDDIIQCDECSGNQGQTRIYLKPVSFDLILKAV